MISISDIDAAALTRIPFDLRRTDGDRESNAARRLRRVVALWADHPGAPVDVDEVDAIARSLRGRRNPQCSAWAAVVAAIRTGDPWGVAAARYAAGETSHVLSREYGLSDSALLPRVPARRADTRPRQPDVRRGDEVPGGREVRGRRISARGRASTRHVKSLSCSRGCGLLAVRCGRACGCSRRG